MNQRCIHQIPISERCLMCEGYRDTPMRVVYFAHPLGRDPVKAAQNRAAAKAIVGKACADGTILPLAAWIHLSEVWTEEEGRELGLKIDCGLIDLCQELWICGPTQDPSPGMQIEIAHATKRGKRILDMRGLW